MDKLIILTMTFGMRIEVDDIVISFREEIE